VNCPNSVAVKTLSSSLDRLNEAQWYVQLMQEHYHCAEKFRWALSSFLRSTKEISQIISMEIQQHKDLNQWYKKENKERHKDPIVSYLVKQRDVVVHQKMLETASKGTVGFTRGKGIKLGIGRDINANYDSTDAILDYISFAAKNVDFLGILYTEEDGIGEYTCVQREWRLSSFPETEITTLCAHAWESVAKLIIDLAKQLGTDFIYPKLDIRPIDEVELEIYNTEWIKDKLEIATKYHAAQNT
jgi:hypothetical protein